MPSTKLNDAINQLAEGEFADWDALSRGAGKEFAYLKLCRWHRGRCPYDPDEEKVAFKDYDLNSLRKNAFIGISEGMNKLHSELPDELASLSKAIFAQTAPELQEVMQLVTKLKAHSTKRGYYERLRKIIIFEKRVVMLLFEGKELRAHLRRIKLETAQSKANVKLAAEVVHYRAEFLEAVRNQFFTTGYIDRDKVAAYKESAFAQTDVRRFPFKLVSAKLLIDEFFAFLDGDRLQASRLAERVLELNREENGLSPSDFANLLWRLADYYVRLGQLEKAKGIIGDFELLEPWKEENRKVVFKKYLISIFLIAYDSGEFSYGARAQSAFLPLRSEILGWEDDNEKLALLLCLTFYGLGTGDLAAAKTYFDYIYKIKDQKPHIQYRIQYMIAHLMLLFEGKDDQAIKSFAKNYERYFRANLPFAEPALKVLIFLRLHVLRNHPKRISNDFKSLITSLKSFQTSVQFGRSLWYPPLLKWFEGLKISKSIDDYDVSNAPKPHPKRQ